MRETGRTTRSRPDISEAADFFTAQDKFFLLSGRHPYKSGVTGNGVRGDRVGCVLLRFPNADSPFGLAHQNADVTHLNAIGRGKVLYWAQVLQADVLALHGQARPSRCGALAPCSPSTAWRFGPCAPCSTCGSACFFWGVRLLITAMPTSWLCCVKGVNAFSISS